MNDMAILRKLRAAHIPTYAYKTNFEREHLHALRARITDKQVTTADNPVNFYIYAGDGGLPALRKACIGVALMAKALCLQGIPVVHTTLAGLLREQRMAEMEREQATVNPVLKNLGTGYLAISDILEFSDVEQKYGYHSVHLAADYLIEHVERGGGLILGAAHIPPSTVTQFGVAFSALLDTFEAYSV
jgi:hypothetical protein